MEKNNNIGKILRIVGFALSLIIVIILEAFSSNKYLLVKTIFLLFNFICALTFVKGEKNNALRVLLLTLLYLALFSWFLPAASFQTELAKTGFTQIGLFDLLSNYFATAMQYFGTYAFFVLVVGGFYGVLYVIPGYRSLLDKIVRGLEGNEKLFVIVMMILLAVLTSICGMQLGLLIFFPFLAAIILLLGYDKIVVALTLVGSTMVGIMGTTIASSNISYLIQYLAGSDEAVNYNTALSTRTAVLLLGLILLIIATVRYMKKSATVTGGVAAKTTIESAETPVIIKEVTVEENRTTTTKKTTKKKSTKKNSKGKGSRNNNKAFAMERDVIAVKEDFGDSNFDLVPKNVDGTHSTLPIIIAFVLLFVIFVLAFIPWSGTLGITAFEDATTAVQKFKIFKFALFDKLLGTTNPFGAWAVTDLIPVLIIFSLLLGLIYRVKMSDLVQGFINGIKKAIVPAAIVILVYVGLVIVTFHGYQLSIYSSVFDLAKGHFNFFAQLLTAINGMLSGLFNSDPTYAFNALVPYFTSIFKDTSIYPQVMVLMQFAYGFSMLIAPTSLILVIILSTLNVSFKEWLKNTWLFLLVMFVSVLLITTIWSPIFTWILVGVLGLVLVLMITDDWIWRIFAFICEVLIALILIFTEPILTGILIGLMIIGFVFLATKDMVLRILGILFAIMLAVMICLNIKLLTIIGIFVLVIIFIISLVYVGLKS